MLNDIGNYWLLCKVNGFPNVYLYTEDKYCKDILKYIGYNYNLKGKTEGEIFINADLNGIVIFRTKPNIPQSVILKKYITVLNQ